MTWRELDALSMEHHRSGCYEQALEYALLEFPLHDDKRLRTNIRWWKQRLAERRLCRSDRHSSEYGAHRNSVIDLVGYYGCKAMAEIGVYKCELPKAVFAVYGDQIESYYMIDPWQKWGTRNPDLDWDELYRNACCVVVNHPQAHMFRLRSEKAASLFPPGSLDLVFIDGDHSYEAVKQDIRCWLPIVGASGVIAGHDYSYSMWGVARAVDEVVGFELVDFLPDTVWFVEKALAEGV